MKRAEFFSDTTSENLGLDQFRYGYRKVNEGAAEHIEEDLDFENGVNFAKGNIVDLSLLSDDPRKNLITAEKKHLAKSYGNYCGVLATNDASFVSLQFSVAAVQKAMEIAQPKYT